jgi:hypothetical protein
MALQLLIRIVVDRRSESKYFLGRKYRRQRRLLERRMDQPCALGRISVSSCRVWLPRVPEGVWWVRGRQRDSCWNNHAATVQVTCELANGERQQSEVRCCSVSSIPQCRRRNSQRCLDPDRGVDDSSCRAGWLTPRICCPIGKVNCPENE